MNLPGLGDVAFKVQEVPTNSQKLELNNEESQEGAGWDALNELEAGLLGPGTIAAIWSHLDVMIAGSRPTWT